jgi:RNA polymerase sigma-70 factor (ECF subfamily)
MESPVREFVSQKVRRMTRTSLGQHVVGFITVESAPRGETELAIRALSERGDATNATTLALKTYGREVFGFLLAVLPSEQDAADAFAEVSISVWRELQGFRWESTLRTWLYVLARNAAYRLRRGAARRLRREAPSDESSIADVVAAVRTETVTFLKTEKRSRLQALRDDLSEEDQMLLILRVDRGLDWNEVARVLATEGKDARHDPPELARAAARLRKRFQSIKDSLRARARREGLLGS